MTVAGITKSIITFVVVVVVTVVSVCPCNPYICFSVVDENTVNAHQHG